MTLTLLNIADMLADVLDFDDVYAGNINANLDRCIGVYNDKNSGKNTTICIGGKACTKTLEKQISILIHWTDNPTFAEEKTNEILDSITDIRNQTVGDFILQYFKCNAPVPIGRDEKGIYEYVIESKIYYERKN